MHLGVLRVVLAGLLWLGTGFWAGAQPANAALPATVHIDQAELHSATGMRLVQLPHKLEASDHTANGGRVRYRLLMVLTDVPTAPLGVFVRRISLSGALWLNGRLVGGCAIGALERLRCLHQPQLWVPPLAWWHSGLNTLEFEVYANSRQTNGLTAVEVGDAEALANGPYLQRRWWQVELMAALSWMTLSLGLLALAVGLVLRGPSEAVYRWFGWTSIANTVVNANWLVSRPLMDGDWFSWLVFSSRFVSIPLLFLTFLAFFDQAPPRLRRGLLAFAAMGVVLIGLSHNNRWAVLGLYVPLLLMSWWLLLGMVRWTWRSRRPAHWMATGMAATLCGCAVLDWLRLGGEAPLDGVYLIGYAYTGVLVGMGVLLVGLMAQALRTSRQHQTLLAQEVDKRTAELQLAHQHLTEAGAERSRAEERDRLLQDMHDGFGSQLASARLLAEQGRLTPEQLPVVLQECMADLHLVVDTLSEPQPALADALVDMRFRTQRRLCGAAVQLHWQIELDAPPALTPRVVLQLLRIVQEALNNALKHAQARHIWIAAVWHANSGQLHIAVRDDGVGSTAATSHLPGRGLHNMQHRARDIGTTLTLHTQPPCFAVELCFVPIPTPPLEADPA